MKKITIIVISLLMMFMVCFGCIGCNVDGKASLNDVLISVQKDASGKSYSVTGIGAHTSETLEIPSKIDGIPVETIKESAFVGASNLKNVIIPESVKTLEDSAFMLAKSLERIELKGVVTIGARAFFNCTNLKNIVISDSIHYVGTNAFMGCEALEMAIYDTAKYIGNEKNPYVILMEAIDKEIVSCDVSDGCKIINHRAFANCERLVTVDFADVTTQYGDSSFISCYSLSHPVFSRDLEVIGENAFRSCKVILSVTIGIKLKKVGNNAFSQGEYACDIDHVYYAGSKEDWLKVEINAPSNAWLNVDEFNPKAAKWHYNYKIDY
jgi:hypothetical protein